MGIIDLDNDLIIVNKASGASLCRIIKYYQIRKLTEFEKDLAFF